MKVLLALSFLMLWPSVLSATSGTWEEYCAPAELEDVVPRPDVVPGKPEICIKERCDEAYIFYATRNVLPMPRCLNCLRFFEPYPDMYLDSPTLYRLKAHIAEREMKTWLETCTPYWENRLTDGPPLTPETPPWAKPSFHYPSAILLADPETPPTAPRD